MKQTLNTHACSLAGEGAAAVKYHITSITQVLQDFADFFSISLVINIS